MNQNLEIIINRKEDEYGNVKAGKYLDLALYAFAGLGLEVVLMMFVL